MSRSDDSHSSDAQQPTLVPPVGDSSDHPHPPHLHVSEERVLKRIGGVDEATNNTSSVASAAEGEATRPQVRISDRYYRAMGQLVEEGAVEFLGEWSAHAERVILKDLLGTDYAASRQGGPGLATRLGNSMAAGVDRLGNWAVENPQGVNRTFLGIAALSAGYQIARSDDPAHEAVHQTYVMGGAYLGASYAASVAAGPCLVAGPGYPVCVLGATALGGALGAMGGGMAHQGVTSLTEQMFPPGAETAPSRAEVSEGPGVFARAGDNLRREFAAARANREHRDAERQSRAPSEPEAPTFADMDGRALDENFGFSSSSDPSLWQSFLDALKADARVDQHIAEGFLGRENAAGYSAPATGPASAQTLSNLNALMEELLDSDLVQDVLSAGRVVRDSILSPEARDGISAFAAALFPGAPPSAPTPPLLPSGPMRPSPPSTSRGSRSNARNDIKSSLRATKAVSDFKAGFFDPGADSFAVNLENLWSESTGLDQILAGLGLGLGTKLAMPGFTAHLHTAGLLGSYRASNPFASFRQFPGSEKSIGGVGNQVGLIADVVNAPDETVFCFPKTDEGDEPCTHTELKQIGRELAEIFTHNSVPMYSLDFSAEGYLIPDLDPVYRNSLVGTVMGDLDYYLKCLLNGVTYEAGFTDDWYKSKDLTDETLREKLVDLKKEFKDPSYVPLREMMKRAGIVDLDFMKTAGGAFEQPFRSSFRIIAKTRIERSGKAFIVHPDFDIECTMYLNPSYEAFLKQYCQEHGCNPPEYQKTLDCYEQFKFNLKGYLLKLPTSRKLINKLGIINFYCSLYKSLQAVNKIPSLDVQARAEEYITPNAFPPLPVPCNDRYPLQLKFGEVLEAISTGDMDGILFELFTSGENELPGKVSLAIREALIKLMIDKLKPSIADIDRDRLNQTDLESLVLATTRRIMADVWRYGKLCREEDRSVIIMAGWRETPALAREQLFSLLPNTLMITLGERSVPVKEYFDSRSYSDADFVAEAVRIYSAHLTMLKDRWVSLTKKYTQEIATNCEYEKAFKEILDPKEQYIDSSVRTSPAAYVADGIKFVLKGGCGFSLVEGPINVVADSEGFDSAMVTAREGKAVETWTSMSHDGKSYVASSLRVIDDPALHDGDHLSLQRSLAPKEGVFVGQEASLEDIEQVKVILTQLAKNPAYSPHPFIAKLFTKIVDASGAYFIHYAAALLSIEQLEKVLSLNLEQLKFRDRFKHSALHAAAAFGNVSAVEALIKRDPSLLNETTFAGETPLIMAVQNGQKAVAESLIKAGAKIDHIMPNALYALYLSIQSGFSDIASLLADTVPSELSDEAQKPFILSDGMTPLHLAIEYGFTDVIKKLVTKKLWLKVPRKSDGLTPLHLAASLGRADLVAEILAQGVDVHSVSPSGKTALHIAAEKGHLDAVVLLLSKANVNAQTLEGDTALMLAIKNRHFEVARALAVAPSLKLAKTVADKEAINNKGQTASLLAAEHNAWGVFRVLTQRDGGENIKLCDNRGLNSIYYVLRNGNIKLFEKMLKDRQIDLTQTFYGESLIQVAERYGHFFMADRLRGEGVDLTPEEDKHRAMLAVQHDDISVLQECMPITEDEVNSLACLAAERVSTKSFEVLQPLVSDPATKKKMLIKAIQSRDLSVFLHCLPGLEGPLDEKGNTALHYAVLFGSRLMVDHLLKSGSKATVMNRDNKTPFHLAVLNDDAYVLKRLLKATPREEWPKDLGRDLGVQSAVRGLLGNKKYAYEIAVKPPLTSIPSEVQLALNSALRRQEFLAIKNIISLHPGWVNHYRSNENKTLLRVVLERVDLSTNEEEVRDLLKEFRKQGLDRSESNPLSSLFGVSDEIATQRFKLFKAVFADALPGLLADDKFGVIPQILNRHLPMLFKEIFPDVESSDAQLRTPLMFAAAQGNLKLMQDLLNQGANPDALDLQGRNALHYAIDAKNSEAALFLIPLLRHKNKADRLGRTPLFSAISQGLLSLVKALAITTDCRVDFDALGQNALHYAAIVGEVEIIEHLVNDCGFDVNQVRKPLDTKHKKTSDESALHLAALQGRLGAVRKLIELGASTEQCDRFGRGVFEYALMGKNKEVWRYLSQLVKEKYPELKSRLLIAAATYNNNDALVDLLSDGADPNATRMLDGSSALQLAISNNALAAVRTLLSVGAAVDYSNRNGDSAMMVAARAGHVALVDLLLKAGAEPNLKTCFGITALYLACVEGKTAVVKRLLAGGADFRISDSAGTTPAQIALSHGHFETVYYLLQQGDQSLRPAIIDSLLPDIKGKIKACEEAFGQFMRAAVRVSTIPGTLFAPARCGAGVGSVAEELSFATSPGVC